MFKVVNSNIYNFYQILKPLTGNLKSYWCAHQKLLCLIICMMQRCEYMRICAGRRVCLEHTMFISIVSSMQAEKFQLELKIYTTEDILENVSNQKYIFYVQQKK